MSEPADTSAQTSQEIEYELVAEVQRELERRGTTLIPRTPDRADDLPASLCANAILGVLGVLAGTGVAMALGYTTSADDAHASVAWFEMSQLGGIVRAMHWHASNLLVLLSAAYLGYLLWRGLYRKPEQWRFWRGGMLLALVLAAGFTGQLLPFDQNALHGTAVRLGYIESLPGGDMIAEGLRGGDELGTGALTRFFGLHAIVLPALLIVLLRWFWADARSEKLLGAQLAVPGVLLLLLAGAAIVVRAPHGLTGDMGEAYLHARPEWYALPLFFVLKVLPGAAQVAALAAPPVMGALVVFALPIVEKVSLKPPRLQKPLRVAIILGALAFIALSIVPLVEDSSRGEGWFQKDDVQDLMLAMGRHNAALGHSTQEPAGATHRHALDLRELHRRLKGVYPDNLDAGQKAKWDELAVQGEALSRELLLAPPSRMKETRSKLREVCQSCHDAHEKGDVPLEPALAGTVAVKGPRFFDVGRAATLTPEESQTSTKRIMDQGRFRMADILIHAGIATGEPKKDKEQALVDLRRAGAAIAGLYSKNNAVFEDEGRWNNWAKELNKAIEALAEAKDAEDVGKKMAAVGKACETCHEGADYPDEPIEWAYSSLLK
ncbi:MAG: cytochrome b N-terminal domain-containing protein [Planctomycetes bacterium]|nr:cytochrome b N-terminal domain-containing protein [Planctomycetota bacterium]MCW8135146.1 cytochrome b N-terminal domain-containing protein [Planctomycetota bacterium]